MMTGRSWLRRDRVYLCFSGHHAAHHRNLRITVMCSLLVTFEFLLLAQ